MDGQITVRFKERDLIAVRELGKIYDITPGKFIRISVDHMLKTKTDKEWIIKEFIEGEKVKKIQKKLSKDEQAVEDAKKRLKEIDIELEKSKSRKMNIKTAWEGQDGYKSPEEVKQQIEAGRKEWGLTPEEMIKRK